MKHIILLSALLITSIIFSQKPTPQEKAELAVNNHLKKTFKNSNYKSYMFSDLIKITPPEIIAFEDYRKAIASIDSNNDSLATYYDSILKEKLKTIKQKKLHPTYEISHFFTLKKNNVKPVLYEYTFTLFPDGKIKNVSKNLEYHFTGKEYDYFYRYYRKTDLYNNNEIENKKTYEYLNNLYQNETINKKSALSTILTVTRVIYDYNVYDTVLISHIEAKKWINQNLKNSIVKEYAPLQQIKDTNNNQIIGYKLFIQVLQKEKTKAYYFEFDYDYILRGVLPIENDYKKYFPKKRNK